MTLSFPAGDVDLSDIGVHSTKVDHLAQTKLNSLRLTVESIRRQYPGIGDVLDSQVEELAAAVAAGGRAR